MMLSSSTVRAICAAQTSRFIVGRGMHLTTSSRLGLKESSTQTDVDYEKHKQDSLDKQKKGTGHWKAELASDSEEAVKADRNAQWSSVKELQDRTKAAAEETHKAGTSVKDNM